MARNPHHFSTMSAQQMTEKNSRTPRTNRASGPACRMGSRTLDEIPCDGKRGSFIGREGCEEARLIIPSPCERCQRICPEIRDLFDTVPTGPYKGTRMFHSPGAVALQLGPLTFRWYGILMATAMGIGLRL